MISIIIPHYNRASLLKITVASVLNQTSEDWELIIVDDHSDQAEFDLIKELATKHDRIKIAKRTSSLKGPSSCRNEGVALSKGEWLIFLDSDDTLANFCIEQRSRLVENKPGLSMGIFLMQEFQNIPGDSSRIYNALSPTKSDISGFLEGENPWAVTCPIWFKDFFLSVGGFDENFIYMEDPELHIRALFNGNVKYQTFYDNPADCFYRINNHDDTKKDFYENSIRYRIQFYKKMEIFLQTKSALSLRHRKSFNLGVFNFFTNLLLARLQCFPTLHREFFEFASTSFVVTRAVLIKIKMLTFIYTNENIITRKIRLKGIAFKLLST